MAVSHPLFSSINISRSKKFISSVSQGFLFYFSGEEKQVLNWEERLQIALDISHGIEYLHEGAVPPVIHRDLKSANILLDHSMRAKVKESKYLICSLKTVWFNL